MLIEHIARGRVTPRVGQPLDFLGVVEIRVGDLIAYEKKRYVCRFHVPVCPNQYLKPAVFSIYYLRFGNKTDTRHAVYECNIPPHYQDDVGIVLGVKAVMVGAVTEVQH